MAPQTVDMPHRSRILHRLHPWLRWISVCGVCVLSAFGFEKAQGITAGRLSLEQLSLRVWKQEDGLPTETITALLQSRDGFLWLGSDDGLIRFDGVRFDLHHTRNTPAFRLNRVSHLVESDQGILWVGFAGGGIVRKQGPHYRHYGQEQGLANEQVRTLATGPNGRLWVGTDGGGLYVLSGDRFHPVPNPDPDSRFIVGVVEAPDGSVITASPRAGIGRWDGTNWTQIPAEGLSGPTRWTVLQPGCDGRIWAGNEQGLWLYFQGRLRPAEWPGNPPHPVRAVLESIPGELWLGSQHELHQLTGGVARQMRIGSGFSTRGSGILLRDCEGSIWTATDGLGLGQLKPSKVTTIGAPEGLSHNEVTSTSEGPDGTVWLTTAEGLNRITAGEVRRYTTAEGLPENFLFSSYAAPDGTLWLGARTQGAVRFKDGKFAVLPMEGTAPTKAVWCIHGDATGTVWFGSQRGLHIAHPDQPVLTLTGSHGLSNDDVRSLVHTPDGSLWVGTSYGLNQVRNDRVVTNWTTADGHPIETVVSLHAEADGTLWIGTLDRGLFRFRSGTFSHLSTAEGLPAASVFQILDDRLGKLWMSCGRGIYSVSREELHAVADRLTDRLHATLFGRADGLRTLELTSSVQPAGMRTLDGRLWFPSNRGVAIIDPAHLPRVEEPPLPRIDRVILGGVGTNTAIRLREHPTDPWRKPEADRISPSPEDRQTLRRIEIPDPGAAIEIPPDSDFLELHFTAPTFVSAADIVFRCQLEGFDRGWIDLGTRRVAYYTRVPPGHYTFRVSAVNHDGIASESDATLEVVLLPHWWQSPWLPAGLIAALLLGGAAGHRWRIATLDRRRVAQETFARQLIVSQESERRRIASDLHDSLEQELLVIKNRADLALLDASDPVNAQQQLSEISQLAMHAIEDVRHITHDLRPKLLDRLGITRALRTLLDRIADGGTLIVNSDLDPIDGVLYPTDEINLYRIVQESLNNVLKHAQARSVRVQLSRLPTEIELTIEDDGRGFELSLLDDDHAFGLRGLEERARILGGRLVVESRQGHGTTVRAHLPLRPASKA